MHLFFLIHQTVKFLSNLDISCLDISFPLFTTKKNTNVHYEKIYAASVSAMCQVDALGLQMSRI